MDEPFDRQTLILSAAQPGLGQLASGRAERGLILMTLSLVFGILGGVDGTLLKLLTGGRRPIRALPARLNPLALIWAGIYAYNLYDAYNIAAGLDEEDADLLDYEEYTPGDTAEAYVANGGTRDLGTEGALKVADSPAPSTEGALKVADSPTSGTEGALKVADSPTGGTDGALKVADGATTGGTRDLGTEGALKVADSASGEPTATPLPEGALKVADSPTGGTDTEGALKVADSWSGTGSGADTEGALKVADGATTEGALKVADGASTEGALKVADGASTEGALKVADSPAPADLDAEVAGIRALGDAQDDGRPTPPEVDDEVAALRSMGGNGEAATPARGTVTAGSRSRTFDFGGAGLDWAAGVTKAQLMDALGDDPQVIGVFGNYLPSDRAFHSADEALNLIPVQAWQDAQGRGWTGAEIPSGDEPSGYADSAAGRMPPGDTTA